MNNKIKIKGRITKVGNSYGLIIPKALIDSNIFWERELIELEVVDQPQRSKLRELGFCPENVAFKEFIHEQKVMEVCLI